METLDWAEIDDTILDNRTVHGISFSLLIAFLDRISDTEIERNKQANFAHTASNYY